MLESVVVFTVGVVLYVGVEFTGRAVGLIGFLLSSKYSMASLTQGFCGSAQIFLFLTVVNLYTQTRNKLANN